jgi:hypothetical protein
MVAEGKRQRVYLPPTEDHVADHRRDEGILTGDPRRRAKSRSAGGRRLRTARVGI